MHGLWQYPPATLHGQSGAKRPMVGRKVPMLIVFEDNKVVVKITLKTQFMVLRQVLRTHNVAHDWLSDFSDSSDAFFQGAITEKQVGDTFTQGFN